jgi:hypothetical protein
MQKQKWDRLTSATRAVGAIAVAALDTGSDNLAVDVLGVVDIEVASATAAVRSLSGHDEEIRREKKIRGRCFSRALVKRRKMT